VLVGLRGDLLVRRKNGLDAADVHEHRARVAALLDHPGDDLALSTAEDPEHLVVLDVAQPLDDHLARGGRGDAPEARRRVVVLLAALGVLRPHRDVPGAPVHLHAGVGLGARGVVVGREQRLLDRPDQHVEADLLLPFEEPEGGHVDVHQPSSSSSALSSSSTTPSVSSAYAT